MKKLYHAWALILVLWTAGTRAQNISGVINDYREVTTVGVNSVVVTPNATPFACGDRVIVIQMKGATVDLSNSSSFGNITAYNGAGKYEFAVVSSVVGNQINFAANLINSYNVSGAVQVVRVPVYQNPTVVTGNKVSSIRLTSCGCRYTTAPNVTITGGGGSGATAVARINSRGQVIAIDVTNPGTGYTGIPTVAIAGPSPAPTDFSTGYCTARAVAVVKELTAKQWDGKIGGVLALETPNTLTLNENINVTGMGFRGATIGNTTSGTANTVYDAWTIIAQGEKGEAIAANADSYARGYGKYANGGGGARQPEGGGGGGGNGGAGGRGGNTSATFGSGTNPALGGVALNYSNAENRIFLGGGGGGGSALNGSLTSHASVPGGYGGGIVIIRAAAIATSGAKSIISDGTFNNIAFDNSASMQPPAGAGNGFYGDGGSGGGAGGTLVLQVPAAGLPNTLTLNANGAQGGNTSRNTTSTRYGPGGGGGGGTIWTAGGVGSATATVTGGAAGQNRNSSSWNVHGAVAGNDGVTLTGLSMPGPGLSCTHVADAGPDQPSVLSLTTTLAAAPPICGESGSWSLVSGPGTVVFTPVTAHNATATVSVSGTYVFRWTLVKDGCPVTDDVSVTYSSSCTASPADAGLDKYYCSGSVTMTGNAPPPGESGTWSKVSGPGTVTFTPNATAHNASASFSINGNYVLRWTLSKPGCSDTQDDMNVFHITPPTLSAPTGILCDGFTANWTAVPGATNYRIDVALDAAFTIPVYTNLNAGGGTSFNVTGLVGGTTYYYRMRVNSPCISANSGVQNVTTTMPTTVYWIGGGSNNWFSGINWTCGVVPNASINAVIDNSTAPNWWPIIGGGTAACKDLTITSSVASTATRLLVTGATAVLNVHGHMNVNANTTLPGFTMVVQDGAKLYNNINPTSTARFGPAVSFPGTYYNKKQLHVTNVGSQAMFRQLNITAGIPCMPVPIITPVASFKPWGNSCAQPGVLISNGGAMDVADNMTIGMASGAFEGILWIDNADAVVSGNVDIYNQFTSSSSRGIGLNNGATLDIVGLLSTHTDGASLILENNSLAYVGAIYTNTNNGLPSGGSIVNSGLIVQGDVQLRENCGMLVLGTSDFYIGGNLLINTSFPIPSSAENLIARSDDALYPAFISVDGILDVTDARRMLLWDNSSMTVTGVDVSGVSAYIRSNASCTLRTTTSLLTNGHLNVGGTMDTCSRIVMDGTFLSEPTLEVKGDLNLLANSHLDAASTVVRPVVKVHKNWNRSQINIPTGPNRRGFSRGNKSIVAFIGLSAQAINTPAGDPIELFWDLEINSYNGVTLNSTAKAEVFGNLLLTDGIFNTGAAGNYLWVRNNSPSSVIRTYGHVNGWLYRDVMAHANYYEFPVGKGGAAPASMHYRRMALKFNTVSGFSRVDARFDVTPSVNNGPCPTIDGMVIDGANTGTNGFWSVNPNSGTYTTDYDMRLYLYGMGTFTDNLFIPVSRDDGETNCSDWTGGGSIPAPNAAGRTVASGYAQRNGLTFFSEKAIAPSSTPLAVELTDFNAVPQNDRVLLTWNTVNETNNAYFSVERSAENGAFGEIGRVKGAGTTSEPQSYRTYDLAPLPGTSYYRLKQTDFDGKFAYSRVVSVTFDETGDRVLLYPNPSDGSMETRIRFVSARDRQSTFRLFDLSGRLVWEHATDERHGEAVVPAGALNAGVYVLKTNLSPATQKLVVR